MCTKEIDSHQIEQEKGKANVWFLRWLSDNTRHRPLLNYPSMQIILTTLYPTYQKLSLKS